VEAFIMKSKPERALRNGSADAELIALRKEVARKIANHAPSAGEHATKIAGLRLFRRTTETACRPVSYEPSLVVFVQGRKRINVGAKAHICDESSFLLSSIDMPVTSQILSASEEVPLLSFLLPIDIGVVREILSREDFRAPEGAGAEHGITIGRTTVELLEPCSRLLDLLDAPDDIPFLSGLAQREIFYRVLRGPQGRRLRAIATTGDQSQRTARAIAWLRTNFAKPLRVEELAGVASMGVSTLHHHFRALTAMSPVQYQKRLRLQEARQRMLMDGLDAASAAFEVGYESASQFNREYSRLFGAPPMRDVKALLANDVMEAEVV
jgi:AraC-like DNA-binding protein